jgi:hypothetical protein
MKVGDCYRNNTGTIGRGDHIEFLRNGYKVRGIVATLPTFHRDKVYVLDPYDGLPWVVPVPVKNEMQLSPKEINLIFRGLLDAIIIQSVFPDRIGLRLSDIGRKQEPLRAGVFVRSPDGERFQIVQHLDLCYLITSHGLFRRCPSGLLAAYTVTDVLAIPTIEKLLGSNWADYEVVACTCS